MPNRTTVLGWAFLAFALACGGAAAGEIPIVKLDSRAAGAVELLAGEISGASVFLVSLPAGGQHDEPATADEDKVYLVLHGRGALASHGEAHPVEGETIVRLPVGWPSVMTAAEGGSLAVLVIRRRLSAEDREDLARFPQNNAGPYIRRFAECEAYHEAIKSAKTVSRTLLPEGYVPRMAVGTVQTIGPDRVAPHAHPMLEQLFLGLTGNSVIVYADEAKVDFPADSLLRIPSGSSHWVEVAEGRSLYYVWMDFFPSREGQAWLKGHKPIDDTKPEKP